MGRGFNSFDDNSNQRFLSFDAMTPHEIPTLQEGYCGAACALQHESKTIGPALCDTISERYRLILGCVSNSAAKVAHATCTPGTKPIHAGNIREELFFRKYVPGLYLHSRECRKIVIGICFEHVFAPLPPLNGWRLPPV